MNKLSLTVIFFVFVLVFTICSAGLVEITKPEQKQKVSWRYTVEGNSSAENNSGLEIHVLIWPLAADGPWYVQPTYTQDDGVWFSTAYFGRDPKQFPEDIGGIFRIVAIMTNKTIKLEPTLKELPDLPQSSISQKVVVIRSPEAYEA